MFVVRLLLGSKWCHVRLLHFFFCFQSTTLHSIPQVHEELGVESLEDLAHVSRADLKDVRGLKPVSIWLCSIWETY